MACLTACFLSTLRRYLAWLGLAEILAEVCALALFRVPIWELRLVIWLSTEETIAVRIPLSCWSISLTSGFSALVEFARLLR